MAGYPLGRYSNDILNMSGMLPLFIQMACSKFLEHIQAKSRISGESDIKEIEKKFIQEAHAHFQYIWDGFDESTRNACKFILTGRKIDDNLRIALFDLMRRGYVIEAGKKYMLFSDIFKTFMDSKRV